MWAMALFSSIHPSSSFKLLDTFLLDNKNSGVEDFIQLNVCLQNTSPVG